MYLLEENSTKMVFHFEHSYNDELIVKREFDIEVGNKENNNVQRREIEEKSSKSSMKNVIKNIIIPFRKFCSFLSSKQVDEIMRFGTTFNISLQKSIPTKKSNQLVNLLNQAVFFEFKVFNGKTKR